MMNKRRWLLSLLPILLGLIGVGVWGSQQLGQGAQQVTPKQLKYSRQRQKSNPRRKSKRRLSLK